MLMEGYTPKRPPRWCVYWDRCEETGRKLGVWVYLGPLSFLVRVHRPTPHDPEWAGICVAWNYETVIDTFPVPPPLTPEERKQMDERVRRWAEAHGIPYDPPAKRNGSSPSDPQ
jgi:hypothetical protein